MLRIAHRLASGCGLSEKESFWARKIAENGHIVICDNVAQFFAESPKQLWNNEEHIGAISPWKIALHEWVCPQAYDLGNGVTRRDGPQALFAVASLTNDLDATGHRRDTLDQLKLALADLTGDRNGWQILKENNPRCDDARWFTIATAMVCASGRFVTFPGQYYWFFDCDGIPVGTMTISAAQPDVRQEIAKVGEELFNIFAITNSMANCKNVRVVDSTTEDAPPDKWQRRFGTPAIKYHRIVITGISECIQKEGGLTGGGLKKAWHICRGSFANYSAEAPLFGKYVGRYWRPQHVKGKKELGEVHSTHEVRPSPAPPSA